MSQGSDPFEFIKNFWANVPGMPGAGASPGMPSFDPADLEKRVGQLKQVKQWLEMNLNMLNMQINTLEMQLNAVNSFENYTHKATHPPQEPAPKRAQYSYQPPEPAVEDNEEEEEEGAPPDMSQANAAAGAAAKAAGDAGADAIAQGAQAMQAMPWANPGEWIKSMQAAFAGSAPAVKKSAKGAAKTAAKSKTPARRAAPKTTARPAAPKKPRASTAAPARPTAAQPAAKRAPKSRRPRKSP